MRTVSFGCGRIVRVWVEAVGNGCGGPNLAMVGLPYLSEMEMVTMGLRVRVYGGMIGDLCRRFLLVRPD
jgi:hypothetical protein